MYRLFLQSVVGEETFVSQAMVNENLIGWSYGEVERIARF